MVEEPLIVSGHDGAWSRVIQMNHANSTPKEPELAEGHVPVQTSESKPLTMEELSTLVISDSIIKAVPQLLHLQHICLRGATIRDVRDRIKNGVLDMGNYANIVFHLGTNDCDPRNWQKRFTVQAWVEIVLKRVRTLLETVKELKPDVCIFFSAIIPRPCDFEVSDPALDAYNSALRHLCQQEMGVAFITMARSFLMGKGKKAKPRSSYYVKPNFNNKDMLHLNASGVGVLKMILLRFLSEKGIKILREAAFKMV